MRKLIVAIFAVALLAMPAFASVQNIKVKGSIDNTFLHRDNFDLGAQNGTDLDQNVFFTQTTVGIDADLSDNVSATVGLINERVWNNNPGSTSSGVDIYQAYVTLREMLYSPLTVVVGRQNFHYGNSFIIDSTGTNNSAPSDSGLSGVAGDLTKQTAQDAFRAILDYNPLKLELLFSKLSSGTNVAAVGTEEGNADDTNLYGVNASYEVGDAMKTQVEAYFFAKVDESTKSAHSSATNKHDTVYVPGLRASTNPIEGLNVQGEIAWQKGVKVISSATNSSLSGADNPVQRDALGIQFIANYQVPVLKEYKPVAQYVYTWVTGDENQTFDTTTGISGKETSQEKWTAWDPMFENQASGKVYNSLFNLSNAHIHGTSLQVSPMEDVSLTGSFTALFLDKNVDCRNYATRPVTCTGTIVAPDGSTRTLTNGFQNGGSYLGKEIDLDAVYNYTEDVQIGANLGIFYPGEVFFGNNSDAAKQVIVHANVNF